MSLLEFDSDLRAKSEDWCAAWGVAPLAHQAQIAYSTRQRTSLGRARYEGERILLNAVLRDSALRPLLEEVLCHELAHLAARRLHGPGIRPHGKEWKALLRSVGHCARVTVPSAELPPIRSRRRGRRRAVSASISQVLLAKVFGGIIRIAR